MRSRNRVRPSPTIETIHELSPAAQAGAPLPSPLPGDKFAPAAAASVVAPETKAISVPAGEP